MGTRLGEPGQPSRLTIDERLRDEVEMLKELTWQYVIKGPALAAQQHGFRRIVKKLFEVFAEATLSPKPNRWWVLPRGANDTISSLHRHGAGAIPDAVRFRVAADAIAGMTDRQALLMYQRLMGIASGSILDVIVG
jgi:dGTPase